MNLVAKPQCCTLHYSLHYFSAALNRVLLSAILAIFTTFAHAQTVPPSESYKPDPIATTSQALQGKLFFNDTERARADKMRKDLAEGRVVVNEETTYSAPVLSGFIKRSDGVTTYWVNNGNASDTRFVVDADTDASKEILATSTMVGGEPKFVLTGTTVGDGAAKVEKKAKDVSTQKSVKTTKRTPLKKQKKNKRIKIQK
jgi:hypothetical protein